jgi:RND superfamily putative drug exporter
MCAGLAFFNTGLTSANGFRGTVESVEGQELIAASFPAGASAPTTVLVQDVERTEDVRAAVAAMEGISSIGESQSGDPGVRFPVVLVPDPFSPEAYDLIPEQRDVAKAAGGESTLVGGPTAEEADVRVAATRDTLVLPPIILLVVLVILGLLLRAIVAPLLLVGTVILSFLAALGFSVFLFNTVFDSPGQDPSLPLFGFVFLVALGVDYNIFLMARAREETPDHGTRGGILRALAVTGGVITSAGIVLAGTFAVLGVLPLWALFQIGFLVGFGVLLDALIVRSLLVPALVSDIGPPVWRPSALARSRRCTRRARRLSRQSSASGVSEVAAAVAAATRCRRSGPGGSSVSSAGLGQSACTWGAWCSTRRSTSWMSSLMSSIAASKRRSHGGVQTRASAWINSTRSEVWCGPMRSITSRCSSTTVIDRTAGRASRPRTRQPRPRPVSRMSPSADCRNGT